MRKRLAQRFLGWQLAIVLVLAVDATAHAQWLDRVTRARALEAGDFPREVVRVGALPDGIDEQDWERVARQAVATWNDVPCSFAELTLADPVETIDELADAATPVAFVDANAEPCFAATGDVGWTLQTPCGDWPATTIFLNTAGFDWRTAPDPYTTDPVVDLPSALTHELGHALGLHHDDVRDPLATMAPRYLRDGGLASLTAEDKLALCALYPTDDSECRADAECPGACVDGVCDELRVGPGYYCDVADLNCADGATCLFTSPSTYSGYCAPGCAVDDDCPDDMACTDELCQLTALTAPPGDCTTAAGRPGSPLVLLLVIVVSTRARLRRSAVARPTRGCSSTAASRSS